MPPTSPLHAASRATVAYLRRIAASMLTGVLLAPSAAFSSTPAERAKTLSSDKSSTEQVKPHTPQGVASGPTSPKTGEAATAALAETYGRLPLSFEANRGQADPRAIFLSRGSGYTLFVTATGSAVALGSPAAVSDPKVRPGGELTRPISERRSSAADSVVEMTLAGSDPRAGCMGLEDLPGRSNYFIGNDPKRWRTDVPTFGKVRCEGVYPGIDVVYYGNQRNLESDFVVSPGADVRNIGVDFKGVSRIHVDKSGDLVLKVAGGELRQSKPFVYQEIDGRRREVAGRFVLKGRRRVGFEVADYDTRRPLVIDPVLTYSTYLGGDSDDVGSGIAVDSSGNAYATGYTTSTNFPTLNPFDQTFNGGPGDVFVTKLNPSGTALLYSTYIGGSIQDTANSIALDSAGNAYITGYTSSSDFPTRNPLQPTKNGVGYDAFVTKLSSTGSALVYSTYLGGSTSINDSMDMGSAIAVDSSGNAYVAGYTNSTNFTVVSPFQQSNRSGTACSNSQGGDRPCHEGFVTKINSAGTGIVYSTYLGGADDDRLYSIAIDSTGNAYVTGHSYSTDFPTAATPLQPAKDGPGDAIVAKISPSGASLIFSTYLGGSGFDAGNSIRLDSSGSVYVAGYTYSNNFPSVNAYSSVLRGGGDAFVSQLNSAGTALLYSTYLGGNDYDYVNYIDVSDCGNAYVVGTTYSTDFPVTAAAVKPTFSGTNDVFVTKLNRAGNALAYSTYLGGNDDDQGLALRLDSSENAYITGLTFSSDFTVTAGAYRTTFGGVQDAFVAKLALKDYTGDPGTAVVAPDATAGSGPFTAASIDYHPGADSRDFHPTATPDPTVLPDRATEIWAKYYWPQGLPSGPYPLAVFLHGNHGTCGYGSNPRIDIDSLYTTTGTCPTDQHLSEFITGGTLASPRNNFSGWVGMKITVGARPLTVRSLGRIFLTGNTRTHELKIVRVSDNVTVTPSVSVSMVGGTANRIKYVNLPSPVTLAANTSYYVVSQEASGGDFWYDSSSTVTSTAVATVNGQIISRNSGWNTSGMVAGRTYGPVSFLYEDGAYSVAPSHRGYDYLANKLASLGYVVVSINANLGINAGGRYVYDPDYPDFPYDPFLIYARARLVLRHLQLLSQWNSGAAPTPTALGVDFRGKIDFSNIGLMGHSRGGEGMRVAYNLYRDAGSPWPARIIGSTLGSFKGIFEIAPVDKQTERVFNADGVAWNVLLPACDGDVMTLKGVRVFDRMMLSAGTEQPATQKSTFTVWGANHNFYNTQWQVSEWGSNDPVACIGTGNTPLFLNPTITGTGYGSIQQQQTALSSVIAFFRANVGPAADASFNQNFDPRFVLPPSFRAVTRAERGYTPSPNSNVTTVFEDFDRAAGVNSSGAANESAGISISHTKVRDHDYSPDPPYYDLTPLPPDSMILKAGAITWSAPGLGTYFQSNWRNPGAGADVSTYQTLDFRVSRQESPTNPAQPHSLNSSVSTNFTIQLVMADGSLSGAVCLDTYADLRGPVGANIGLQPPGDATNELHPVMETVRIPLADFNVAGLSQVRGIRMTFNRTASGAIYVANIRFTR